MTDQLAGAPLPGPSATRALEQPQCVVAVGAHPDDIEFHGGATLARWAAGGTIVHVVICTDGAKGTWDVTDDPTAVAARRAAEATDAAAALGATGEVLLLGAVDGELAAACTPGAGGRPQGASLHDDLVGALRRLRPDVVLGHDPWRRYRLHPDHRAAGFLVVDACVAARDPHFVPHRGPAHRPSWLLLFEADEPNHVEEADAAALQTKVAALLAHRSQWRSTMAIDDADDGASSAAFAESVVAAAVEVGAAAGCGPAESFRRLAL